MIKKERKIPLKILKLEALLRRLPSNHPQRNRINEDLAKSKAGFHGEQSLDYYLSFLPDNEFFILHDLRLSLNDIHYFQLDTLILSTRYFLILEVKNISGTLYFDQLFHQLIRTSNHTEEAFPDPVLQVKRQSEQLESWIEKHKLPPIPITSLIVISNSSTIIRTSPQHNDLSKKVIHAAMLPSKLKCIEQLYKEDKITKKELAKFSRLLNRKHTLANPNILQQFQIEVSDIQTGAHCPHCFKLPLKRIWGEWYCSYCKSTSKNAHIASLKDYALLVNPTITNQQLRDFLHLPSISVSTKLLTSMALNYSGSYKNRKYELPLFD